MIAIEIQHIPKVMAKLLLEEAFDRFQLIEASVMTANTYTIDGRMHPEFFEESPASAAPYALWKDIRPFCLSLIRGRQTPLQFKFVFSMREQDIRRYLEANDLTEQAEEVASLSFCMQYRRVRPELAAQPAVKGEDRSLKTCTTGIAYRSFIMDRSAEKLWDHTIEEFVHRLEGK